MIRMLGGLLQFRQVIRRRVQICICHSICMESSFCNCHDSPTPQDTAICSCKCTFPSNLESVPIMSAISPKQPSVIFLRDNPLGHEQIYPLMILMIDVFCVGMQFLGCFLPQMSKWMSYQHKCHLLASHRWAEIARLGLS